MPDSNPISPSPEPNPNLNKVSSDLGKAAAIPTAYLADQQILNDCLRRVATHT